MYIKGYIGTPRPIRTAKTYDVIGRGLSNDGRSEVIR